MHLNATPVDGRADTPARYRVHLSMEGVQGFTQSHWAPPMGKYSRRIAPADNGVACRIKKDEKVPYLLAVSLALAVRRYDIKHIARRRGSRATMEATGCYGHGYHHWTFQCCIFGCFLRCGRVDVCMPSGQD